MADNVVTLEVQISYRFKLSTPDPGYYKCYARVIKPGESDTLPGDTVIVSGHSDMYVDKGQKLIMSGVFDGIDTYKGDAKHKFKISQIVPAKDYSSLLSYFSSTRFKGVGRRKAEDIVRILGLDCLAKIQNNPACLDKIPSLTDEMRADIAAHINGTDIDIEVRKIYPSVSQKFLDYMNDVHIKDGLLILKKDPYILLNERAECPAITFELIDAIGKSLGVGETSIHRIKYAVRYVTKELSERNIPGIGYGGNAFINLSDLSTLNRFKQDIIRLLNIDWSIIEKAIMSEEAGIKLINCYGPNNTQICGCYLKEHYLDEKDAGDILRQAVLSKSIIAGASNKQILQTILDYNTNFCAGAPLIQEQILAIHNIMTHRVSVLTGGPGSGKTTVIRAAVYAWQELCNQDIVPGCEYPGRVILAAPTGMAVRRMNESVEPVKPDLDKICAEYSTLDISPEKFWESRTIASYVFPVKNKRVTLSDAQEQKTRGKNALVIIDESSMMSLEDFAAFLRLVPDAQFLFVGDTDQLPSIAPGEVLYNLCSTDCIPVSRLTINHRSKNAMAIGENIKRIYDGRIDLITDPGVFDISCFAHEDANMLNFVVKTYFDELKFAGDLKELAMIVPMNQKGVCCVTHMNTILRDRLNPVSTSMLNNQSLSDKFVISTMGNEIQCMVYRDVIDKKTYKLRIGDRVVITQNNCAEPMAVDKNNKPIDGSVVNGDRGYIRKYEILNKNSCDESHSVYIELDDGRTVMIKDANLKHVELAYATSVHKSQGCEYKSVIFIAQAGMCFDGDFATRNLIYTGITRAKRHCHIIGLQSSIEFCIQHERHLRNSMLSYRIMGMM